MIKSIVPAALVAAALVQGTATDFVELDVVALDRHGSPVTDLAATDFDVRDGGNRVRIQTFSQIAARGIDADEERSVVILMDDGDMLRVRFHRRRQRQFAHVVRIDDDALEEVRVADLVEQELGLRERLMNRSGDRQRERGLLIPLAGNLGDGRTIAESWRGDERTESAVTRANAPNEPADLLVRRFDATCLSCWFFVGLASREELRLTNFRPRRIFGGATGSGSMIPAYGMGVSRWH